MKLKFATTAFLFVLSLMSINTLSAESSDEKFVTISGIVTDFSGNVMSDSSVILQNERFEALYEAKTNKDGSYSMNVRKGVYQSMLAIRLDEYPSNENQLPQQNQRLETWVWNIHANNDLVIDLRYDRLEVYGLSVYRVPGGAPGVFIYCRPMSLTRYFSLQNNGSDKLCPEIQNMEIDVEINGIESEIHTIQMINEYNNNDISLYGYLLHVETPKDYKIDDINVFKVKIKDLENNDTGESVYYTNPIQYE